MVRFLQGSGTENYWGLRAIDSVTDLEGHQALINTPMTHFEISHATARKITHQCLKHEQSHRKNVRPSGTIGKTATKLYSKARNVTAAVLVKYPGASLTITADAT